MAPGGTSPWRRPLLLDDLEAKVFKLFDQQAAALVVRHLARLVKCNLDQRLVKLCQVALGAHDAPVAHFQLGYGSDSQ